MDGKNLCEETIKDMSDDGNKIMTKEKVPAFVISRYEQECHRLSAPFSELSYMYYPYGISLYSLLLTCRLLRLHRWSGRELLQRRLLQYMVPLQSEHLHPLLGHGEPSHGGRRLPVQLRLLLALAGFGVRLSSGWA